MKGHPQLGSQEWKVWCTQPRLWGEEGERKVLLEILCRNFKKQGRLMVAIELAISIGNVQNLETRSGVHSSWSSAPQS